MPTDVPAGNAAEGVKALEGKQWSFDGKHLSGILLKSLESSACANWTETVLEDDSPPVLLFKHITASPSPHPATFPLPTAGGRESMAMPKPRHSPTVSQGSRDYARTVHPPHRQATKPMHSLAGSWDQV